MPSGGAPDRERASGPIRQLHRAAGGADQRAGGLGIGRSARQGDGGSDLVVDILHQDLHLGPSRPFPGSDLLQGTLDLLVCSVPCWRVRCTAGPLPTVVNRSTSRSSRARSTRPCTGSRIRGRSSETGECRSRGAAPGSIPPTGPQAPGHRAGQLGTICARGADDPDPRRSHPGAVAWMRGGRLVRHVDVDTRQERCRCGAAAEPHGEAS